MSYYKRFVCNLKSNLFRNSELCSVWNVSNCSQGYGAQLSLSSFNWLAQEWKWRGLHCCACMFNNAIILAGCFPFFGQ